MRQLLESTSSTYKLLKITQSDKLFSPFYFLISLVFFAFSAIQIEVFGQARPGTIRHKAYNVSQGGRNERYREKFIKNNVCARALNSLVLILTNVHGVAAEKMK